MTKETTGDVTAMLPARDRHLFSDAEGMFPVGKLGGLEKDVLDLELSREQTVAWYRNPSTGTRDAIQVPWHDGQRWRSMQPDFLFFIRKPDGDVGVSLVDPHGHHLADALGKLRGLARFAEEFPSDFLRVEAITMNRGDLLCGEKGEAVRLDLTDPEVRRVVEEASGAAEAYGKAGQPFR
jgi:type III restriction enzyme